jgi:hypothetical protein
MGTYGLMLGARGRDDPERAPDAGKRGLLLYVLIV